MAEALGFHAAGHPVPARSLCAGLPDPERGSEPLRGQHLHKDVHRVPPDGPGGHPVLRFLKECDEAEPVQGVHGDVQARMPGGAGRHVLPVLHA